MRHLNRWLASVAILFVFGNGVASAQAVVDVEARGEGIHLSIGAYPQLVPIPGYPVYYAPDLGRNYFFYDGLYWVYHHDRWFASDWYDGPWEVVDAFDVPLFILRIPVRYYADPPPYFHAWDRDRAPRWHEYWGRDWADAHRGWDRFDRRDVPPLAPLPDYQRRYQGDRYPSRGERDDLRSEHYRYRPQDPSARGVLDRRREYRPEDNRDRYSPQERRHDDFRPEERRPGVEDERREEDRSTPERLLDMLRDERSHDSRPPPESVPRREDPLRPDGPPRTSNETGRPPAAVPRPAPAQPATPSPARDSAHAAPPHSGPPSVPSKPPERTERREGEREREKAPETVPKVEPSTPPRG